MHIPTFFAKNLALKCFLGGYHHWGSNSTTAWPHKISHFPMMKFYKMDIWYDLLNPPTKMISKNDFILTFGGFFFFYSLHFTVPSPHCAVPISHLIVLLSHLVVPLFFSSHLMVSFSHCAIPTSHITVLLLQMVVFLFFLTFDGSILTLGEVSVWTKNLSRSCN